MIVREGPQRGAKGHKSKKLFCGFCVTRTYLLVFLTNFFGQDTPLLTEEGWTRHQEKYREASFDGADGVVDESEHLGVLHHPEGVNEFKIR